MMDRKSREYTPVMGEDYPNESQPLTKPRYSDCSEVDLEDSLTPDGSARAPPTASSWKYISVVVLLALLCNIASGCFGFYYGKRDLDAVCSAYTTEYCELRRSVRSSIIHESNSSIIAPVLTEVGIKYDYVHYNGSFLAETIYRQRASPAVDDAWEELGVNCMKSHRHVIFATNG